MKVQSNSEGPFAKACLTVGSTNLALDVDLRLLLAG